MAKGHSLQEPFLNALRKERIPVSVYLVNGIKPVSYTHLDVYKRQGLPRPAKPPWRSIWANDGRLQSSA